MYKICKTPKSEQRQLEFQEMLLKMLKKQKLKDITIVSLCQQMNISRKTFYQYFDTLDDVMYAIIDRELQSGFLLLEVKPEMERFFSHWKESKWFLDILEKNEISQMLIERCYGHILKNQKSALYEIHEMKYAGSVSAILTVLILWHHGGMQQSPKEMSEMMLQILRVGGEY